MSPPDFKMLIFAHFANKTTPLQRRMIDEWLTDEANQEKYYAWLVEWENQLPIYEPELDAPLARFEAFMRLNSDDDKEFPHEIIADEQVDTSRRINRWWMVAATLLAILALGIGFNRNIVLYQTYHTAYGETRTVHLADGSIVTLNANSTLRVPRFGFGVRSREVILTGEAFFAVQHRTDKQKFIVQTPNGFDVVVHGTEFNVSARTGRAKVMLHKGSIEMDYTVGEKRQKLMLKPGDLVTLNRQNHPQLQHHVSEQPHLAWKDHRFVFDNMKLSEFGQLVSDTYGLHVEIDSKILAQRTLVGSFQANNVDELLQTVSELFDLKVVQQTDKVILKERD